MINKTLTYFLDVIQYIHVCSVPVGESDKCSPEVAG